MTRKLSVIILLLIFGLTNGQPNPTGIQGDGNIKDTFKLVFRQAPNELFGQKSGSSDTIDSYLDGVDEFLKSYVMQLKLTNDSSYYHSMQNELKKIHATEAKRTSKELLSKKNMVLLKLCLLNPEGSRPYFAEWLTLVYPDIANQINSQQTAVLNSDMYIYFKSYLYSVLTMRFPNEKAFKVNRALNYYNHTVYLTQNILDSDDEQLIKIKTDRIKHFANLAKYHMTTVDQ